MSRSKVDQVAISRVVGGQGFVIPMPRFGPMFLAQIRLHGELNRERLIEFPHIGSESDKIIIRAFESVRDGLSVDRFLCDPALSRKLQRECMQLGVTAPEAALNLRLLAIRKNAGRGRFRETKRTAAARDIVERLGLGVEAAMRHITLRFGASVDDMLAHPEIGRAFVEHARRIATGGNEIDYRLCALQIRKGRHISGLYQKKVAGLDVEMISRRWESIGELRNSAWSDAPKDAGLVELRTLQQSLFLLRTRHIAESIEESFSVDAVRRLLRSDHFLDVQPERILLRYLPQKSLPSGTPKAWELFLIHEYRPRFNWPVTVAAQAA